MNLKNLLQEYTIKYISSKIIILYKQYIQSLINDGIIHTRQTKMSKKDVITPLLKQPLESFFSMDDL